MVKMRTAKITMVLLYYIHRNENLIRVKSYVNGISKRNKFPNGIIAYSEWSNIDIVEVYCNVKLFYLKNRKMRIKRKEFDGKYGAKKKLNGSPHSEL